jgi:hypothetical protein
MTKEQEKILEEAKLRYPPGTRFKEVGTNKEYTIDDIEGYKTNSYWLREEHLIISIKETNIHGAYLYKSDQWAIIISKPEVKPSKDKPFYVVVTEENKHILSKWRFNNSENKLDIGKITGLNLWDNKRLEKGHNSANIIQGNNYTFGNEITFEQFLELYPEYKEDKPKFEVGKWYNYDNYNYIKFERLERCSGYNKLHGETIFSGVYKNKDYIANTSMENQLIKLTDLSEIQQYLPINHPDLIKTDIMKFKVNDYIVILHKSKTRYFLKNNIYLQKENNEWLCTDKDSTGGYCTSSYVKFINKHDWRYATKKEIEEYDRLGKPYDVTTLNIKTDIIPEYVECIKSDANIEIGTIYKIEKESLWGINEKVYYLLNNTSPYYTNYFKPSTKEAYDAMNKPKSLVGRYLKYIGTSISEPKYGDLFKVIKDEAGTNLYRLRDNVPECHWEGSENLNKNGKNWELMPEGFIPETKEKLEQMVEQEWIPKVGDWVYFNSFSAGCYGAGDENSIYQVIQKPQFSFESSIGGLFENKKSFYITGKDKRIWRVWGNFRKALPHEIPIESKTIQSKDFVINTDINSNNLGHENHLNLVMKGGSLDKCEISFQILDFGTKDKTIKTELELIPIKKLKTFNN